ncbi:MAG: alpha-N-acetylglucosaminidase TIM-barrel domain-containing protein [Planctomycetota bacterium]|nr:alpha-N-acetylglucosaminidase TIM-barrel domain-containing protein [Planctomycetota bacterium]
MSGAKTARTAAGALLILVIVGLWSSAAAEVAIVKEGKSQAAIVISEEPSHLEALAASELSRYVKEITGIAIPVVTGKDEAVKKLSNLVLLGKADTNSLIEKLARAKLLKLSSAFPGSDGFVIKTITSGKKNYLVLGGSTDRGTLYAVYHFLEKICRVGFFWDGERVPSMEALSVKDTDIVERPYFPERCSMVSSYAWVYWNTSDWKREVDWLAKKKFNISWGLVRPALNKIALYEVFSDLGVKAVEKEKLELERMMGVVIGDLDKFEQYQVRMAKDILSYARSRGIDLVYEAFGGGVPEEFVEKYPDSRHFESKWADYVTCYLHPADPFFTKIGSAYTKKQHQMFGSSHLYYISPYPEIDPGETRRERDELQLSFAKGVIEGIKTADPRGRWFCSGWAFLAGRTKTWDNQAVKQFLDGIPNDSFLVWDVWAEMHPLYKWTDYFFGKDWAFGVLHCLGGNVGIFGDVRDLIKRVHDVTSDPKAGNCKQFYLSPEGIPYNSMYLDLTTQLAWDPKKIKLESYLVDFVTRRYGAGSTDNMVKCWQELVKSVHSTNRYNDAFYQRRLGGFPSTYVAFTRSSFVPDFTERLPYIRHLKNALEYALRERHKQADNKLYQHDLVDITKQYLGELFNYHLLQLYRSFAKGEQVKFETEAKTIGRIMDDLEKIVSTREDYQMEPIIKKALKTPGVTPDTAKRVRDSVSGFSVSEGKWSLWDYNAKDYFELFKGYHRKRVDFYLATLRKKLQLHQTKIDCKKELDPTYRRITLEFINNDLKVKPEDRYQGNSAQAAAEIFSAWKDISSLDLTPLFGREVKLGSKVVWEDDFSRVGDWKPLSGKGIFTSDDKVVTMKSTKEAFSYGFDLPKPVSLSRHVVISFRAQLVGSMARLSTVAVIWTDSAGRQRHTYLYPTSEMWATGEWEEYRVNLSGLLSLLGELENVKPVTLKAIHLGNRPAPCEVRWDWMKVTTLEEE